MKRNTSSILCSLLTALMLAACVSCGNQGSEVSTSEPTLQAAQIERDVVEVGEMHDDVSSTDRMEQPLEPASADETAGTDQESESASVQPTDEGTFVEAASDVILQGQASEAPADEPVEQATDEPAISVGTNSASAGDRNVEIAITVKNNPGILGMILTLNYDDTNLTLTDVENGDAAQAVLNLTKPGEYVSGCRFLWDGVEITPDETLDGTFLTLSFSVSDQANCGTYPIEISVDERSTLDNNLAPISFLVQNGEIQITPFQA